MAGEAFAELLPVNAQIQSGIGPFDFRKISFAANPSGPCPPLWHRSDLLWHIQEVTMAFYRKNIRSPEQVVRIAAGLVAAVAAFGYLTGWLAILIAAGGVVLALTGIVGYCPMCAMAGIDRRKGM